MAVSTPRIFLLTTLAMLAFAANSLFCRLALANSDIDAASFTLVRLLSGAMTLLLIVAIKEHKFVFKGNWISGFALFGYAAGFSFAYLDTSTGMGALLLFGTVQIAMITYGLITGERLSAMQVLGFSIAAIGLFILLLPGVSMPPRFSSALMVVAGICWAIYSLRGRAANNPIQETTGNFVRALLPSILICIIFLPQAHVEQTGIIYAILSGAVASALGYAIWYGILPILRSTTAATVQLTVPVIAAASGVVILNEELTLKLLLAGMMTLGGVAIFIKAKRA